MKFLVVLACALAVASAGYVAPVATYYAGGQHLPVIGANGVPVDTAEVQHARAAHLAHKVEAHVRNGDYAVAAYSAPVVATHGAYAAPVVAHAYSHAYPVVAQGVPAETPEVVAAKINHFAAHAEAAARTAHPAAVLYRKRRGIYAAAPVAYSAGYSTPYVASTYSHAPVVSSSYVQSPVVSAYSAVPYAHYY